MRSSSRLSAALSKIIASYPEGADITRASVAVLNFIVCSGSFNHKQTMIRLSVNVNKIALLRNARGGSIPDVVAAARTCIAAGGHGVTVHPRPDARHITFPDVPHLAPFLTAQFNIET